MIFGWLMALHVCTFSVHGLYVLADFTLHYL